MNAIPTPTPRELEILKMLWDRGASSVRDVHRHLLADEPELATIRCRRCCASWRARAWAGTTDGRNFIYTARFTRDDTVRVFGSGLRRGGVRVVPSLLEGEKVSAEELERMRTLIDEAAAEVNRREGPWSGSVLNWLLHSVIGGGLLLLAWLWSWRGRGSRPGDGAPGEWAMMAALLLAMLSVGPAWLIVRSPPLYRRVARKPAAGLGGEPAEARAVPPGDPDISSRWSPLFRGRGKRAGEPPDAERASRSRNGSATRADRRSTAPAPWTAERAARAAPVRYSPAPHSCWAACSRACRAVAAAAAAGAVPPGGSRRSCSPMTSGPAAFDCCRSGRGAVQLRAAPADRALPADLRDLRRRRASLGITHELTHLGRRDAWASVLVGLGGAVFPALVRLAAASRASVPGVHR